MSIVLALETTEKFGSVALADGKSLLAEVELPKDRRSAQTLAPAMDAILRDNGVAPKGVDALVVIVGPGSFTGLRVGVAMAKMFAYAVNARILAFRTHEVVAMDYAMALALDVATCQVPPVSVRLSVGVDAQRGDVVVQTFRGQESRRDGFGLLEPESDAQLLPAAQWWRLADTEPETVFAGPALERWHGKTPANVVLAESRFWKPRAGAMIPAALERLEKGHTDDPWTLLPVYARPSAAEERQQD